MDLEESYYRLLGINKRMEAEPSQLSPRIGGMEGSSDQSGSGFSASFINEIFESVNSYITLYNVGSNGRISISNITETVEEFEGVCREFVIGKYIEDTPMSKRSKLLELLHYVRITGNPLKLAVSPRGNDSSGFYMGFMLSTGNILVTWEPGRHQKQIEEFYKKGSVRKKLSEMLPEIIFEVDPDLKILYCNHHAMEFFGCSDEEVNRGLLLSDLFPGCYQDMTECIREVLPSSNASSREFTARRKNGETVPVEMQFSPIIINNRITGHRVVLTDITRQKEYEDQIKREKAFLEKLFDSTPEAIAIIDTSSMVSLINKEFTRLFGYSQEEVAGRNINDLVVPSHLRAEGESIDKLAASNYKVERQTKRKDKSGNLIDVALLVTSIVIDNRIVGHIGIYRDITAEKKSHLIQEILYNISTEALRHYEIKKIYPVILRELGRVWDSKNILIALRDKKNGDLFFPSSTDGWNQPVAEHSVKILAELILMNKKPVLLRQKEILALPDLPEEIIKEGLPRLCVGVPLIIEEETIGIICLHDYEDEGKFTNDDMYLLEVIANHVVIALHLEITLQNLIEARQTAEEAARATRFFMSTMSHEIRTPLNEVIGITNLLLQGNPSGDQKDYLRTLQFSGNHLLTLVNDVLDYNKIESGRIIFEKTRFSLNQFLDNIMSTYSYRSKSKNLGFEIIKAEAIPEEITGDQLRLNQVLSNLLSNALKFTETGKITVTVREVERSPDQSILEFSVTDTGIGIPADMHSMIFERFTRASSEITRKFGGTGLGLAICKKLVELMQGSISLESEPGKGSTFRFTIPVMVPEENIKSKKMEISEDYTGLEKKRILVAEDNKINFFVVNKFLTGWGAEVTHAEDGQSALLQLEKNEFDLILMDLHMPGIDGFEAIRIIRRSENPSIRDIPVVALTAAVMSDTNYENAELNINDYILKPFKPHDLFEKILRHAR